MSIIYSIKWWTRTFKVSTKKLLRMWQRMAKTWGQISATNVSMNLLGLAIWGVIWKDTVEKNQTNATNVTMHPLRQEIWGDTWKPTVEKRQTNATNVRQAIWGHIWKRTAEKGQTNATNATMHPLVQTLWGDIWKRTVEKVTQMQPVRFYILPSKHREGPFENT